METVYGIDLGTTQSCIARIDKFEQAEVLPNFEGKQTTPSVVYYDTATNDVIVGNVAKESWFGVKPENTVAFIKREMPNTNYKRKIGNTQLSPINVSSNILKKMVADANTKLKNDNLPPVTKAVITIPAYFGDLERRRTMEAGKEAGIEVLELINEPVAAALSYSAKQIGNKTFLTYDLGGGTFDVSIIKKQGKDVNVECFDGDKLLGGVDWDRVLANMALSESGIDRKIEDIEETPDGSQLLLEAEKCKISLTTTQSAMLSFIYNGQRYTPMIQRADLEGETKSLLNKTEQIIDRAIQSAKIQYSDIDEIVMVGGSSRMPMVLNMLKRKFNKEPKLVEPDLAVAKGAAIHAHNIISGKAGNITNVPQLKNNKLSKSYGTRTHNRAIPNEPAMIFNFIYKNDSIPISRKPHPLCTRDENQNSVGIEILENDSNKEWEELNKGNSIINKKIEWGYPVPKGTSINIFVEVDENGILNVKAECQGKEIEMIIETK
ncbi:molecular chaperone DnaK [Bacteroidia bacterium]|nr:molecular chaperone DnaK [Bacteroidia bacterium]